jgi:flagellar motor switch protein FliG
MHFLVANFLTREFLQRNATSLAEFEQKSIELDAFALVQQELKHDLVNRVMVSTREFPNA